MNNNIIKRVCKKLGITQEELAKQGEKITIDLYLKFEDCFTLSEAYGYLLLINDLIEIAENDHLFPIPLHNRQNKTKREIFYPNIKFDIRNSLYALNQLFDFIDLVKQPIKQTDLIKYLGDDIDKEKIKNGLWFLSEYGFLKRWTEKNRVWLQINKAVR